MADGLIRNLTVIGIEEEVTQGLFVAPQTDTSFIQTLPGFAWTPAREELVREIIDGSIGEATPRKGMKSVTEALPVEFRASGIEGGDVDFAPLLRAAMGARRNSASSTTKAGNTSSVLQIEDADIGKYSPGDIVLVEEAGAFELRPITIVDSTPGSANITLAFALTAGAPADGVDISAFTTYLTANSTHPSLSASIFRANEIREAGLGLRVTSMALENFQTGQLASWNFALEGLTYTYVDGAAPFTPVFDTGLPPVILEACIFQDGNILKLNNFGVNLENTLAFITDTCNVNGRDSSRVSKRVITGTINPYTDDTDVSQFTKFDLNTEYSLFASAFNPSIVAGEIVLGSAVGIWLPQCISTEFVPGELDGTEIDDITFKATRGSTGTSEEMFLGLV